MDEDQASQQGWPFHSLQTTGLTRIASPQRSSMRAWLHLGVTMTRSLVLGSSVLQLAASQTMGKNMDQCRGTILGGGKLFLEKSNQHDPNKNLGAKKLTPKTQLFHFRFEIIVRKTNSSYLTGSLSQKESLPSPNFSGAFTASFQIERS